MPTVWAICLVVLAFFIRFRNLIESQPGGMRTKAYGILSLCYAFDAAKCVYILCFSNVNIEYNSLGGKIHGNDVIGNTA